MAKKFRFSFFGFNRDDVMSYCLEVKDTETKHKQKITELNEKIAALQKSIDELTEQKEQTKIELDKANIIIEDFKCREESLEKLSESIGRLYIVARSNADAITANANENAKVSEELVKQNVSVVESAQQALETINQELNEQTKAYTLQINQLQERLSIAKSVIEENILNINERQFELENLSKDVENGVLK